MFIFGPIDPHTWPSEAKNWNYGCQSSFVTHHWHLYWVINSLSLLPGTAKGGWRCQSCVTLTLAPKLFIFKGLIRVSRKTEMREFNFWCAAIAQNFLPIFSLPSVDRCLGQLDGCFLSKGQTFNNFQRLNRKTYANETNSIWSHFYCSITAIFSDF